MNIDGLLKDLEQEIKDEENDILRAEQLERLQEMAFTYNGEDRVVSSEELEKLIAKEPKKEKFYSGIETLDDLTEGFVTGESIFLTGITKHGKTSICMELSTRFEEQNPLWLSFEERAIDLLRKFYEKTQHFPMFYTPKQNEKKTLEWIESKIIESKAKFDTKVVFVDHIGFIKDDEARPGEREDQTLERIARAMHSLAVRWDVLIIFMGHLTKVRIDQNPDIENIKGSSAIPQESDLSILVWRKTRRVGGEVEISNKTNVSLQANRRGKTGNVKMVYSNGRFLEEDWSHEDIGKEEEW